MHNSFQENATGSETLDSSPGCLSSAKGRLVNAVPGMAHGTPRHQDTCEGLRERAGCANNDILHMNISMPRDAPANMVTHRVRPVETEAQRNEHLAEGRVSSPGHELRLSQAMITTAAVDLHRDKFRVILCHSASTGLRISTAIFSSLAHRGRFLTYRLAMGLQRRGLGEELKPLVGVQAYNPSVQDEEQEDFKIKVSLGCIEDGAELHVLRR